VRDLLREEHTSTTVEFSAIEERLRQQVSRKLSCLKSSFPAVGVGVERIDRLLDVFVNVSIASVIVQR